MIVEGGEIPPGVFGRVLEQLIAGQLHHARHEHELEKQKLEQKHRGARDRGFIRLRPPKSPGRQENRQEPGFDKKSIPLITEKRVENAITRGRERKIKDDKSNER